MSREPASWVIRRKDTGEVIAETLLRHVAGAVNTEKYEAVPVQKHLASLSGENAPSDEMDRLREELEKANNEFGCETSEWPGLWRRIASLKEALRIAEAKCTTGRDR